MPLSNRFLGKSFLLDMLIVISIIMRLTSAFAVPFSVLLILSLSLVVFASTSEFEFFVSPGETLKKQINFHNDGLGTAHGVRATEYGTATSWAYPDSFNFGDVAPGASSSAKTITINVPQNAEEKESYDLWYSFTADEGDTGGKIHMILTIKASNETNNDGADNNLVKTLQDNWVLILTAGGVISAVTVVALIKKRGKTPDDKLSIPPSTLSETEAEIGVSSGQEIPPPPPDFSSDMPPPPPDPKWKKYEKSDAEKQLEKTTDKLAEDWRKRRGLTFDQEWQTLIDQRPDFLKKFDYEVDPKTIFDPDPKVVFNDPEPTRTWEEAVRTAKKMGKATSLPKAVLGKLSKAELDAYYSWERSYASLHRRYRYRYPSGPRGAATAGRG